MKKFSQLAVPYVVWAALMLVLPMLLIAMYSFTEQGNSIVSFKFTLDHYVKFFTDPDFLIILWRSIWIAIKTTIICLLLGYPIAYYIARSSERAQNLLVLCITIPMWINMLVRTYAWIGLLSEGGLVSRILGFFGLGNMSLLYTQGAVLLGMVYKAQGDTANARAMYQQYIETEGSSPAKGYNGLALCDIDDGNYDNALTDITNGLADASTEEMQDLLYNEVVVYEKKLDFATALSKIQEYLKMFPDDENASKELIFLQSRNGG